MSDPIFGIVIRKVDEEPRPVLAADLSTIGLIGPAPAADADVYPLNTPVKLYSNDTANVQKLGASGYLQDAVAGINDQLGELEAAAQIVIVRTAEGTDNDPAIKVQQTIANIMGTSIAGTGIFAFLKSAELLACTPRLICAPGYTGQMATSLATLVLGTIGLGYVPGQRYELTFAGGGAAGTIALPAGHAIANANGEIHQSDLTIDGYGAWFTEAPTVTLPVTPAAATTAFSAATIAAGALTALPVDTDGRGYLPGESYDITFGLSSEDESGGVAVAPVGHGVANSSGVIGQDEIVIDAPGSGMTSAPSAVMEAPRASVRALATTTIAAGGNPICVALTSVLNQLLAHAIVEPIGTNEADDESWRETINSERIIPVTGGVKIMDPVSSEIIVRSLAPRVAGIIVRRDHQTGAPFHSAANQPVQGIVGPARVIGFSITDGANEGQQLLANNIGVLVRGETGSDVAISSGGFIFVGTDNAGDDPLWQFYNVTRGRDFIHLSLLRALRLFLGRYNITGNAVQAIINTMRFFLRDLQAQGHILGSKVDFKGTMNSAEQIRLGHLTVGFAAEEPPVLRKITTLSARYRPAIDAMVSQLERQLNIAA